MRAFLLAAISLLVACSHATELRSHGDAPKISFGLMKKSKSGLYSVYLETTTIPMVVSDPEFRFGVSVKHRQAGEHVGHIVLQCPAVPGKVASTFAGNEPLERTTAESGRIIKTADVPYKEYWWADLAFNEKDPAGQYLLEVYVDGEMKRSIPFEVVPSGD